MLEWPNFGCMTKPNLLNCFIQVIRTGSLAISDFRSETKGSRFESDWLAMCRGELSAVIARLMSQSLYSGWKR